LSDSTTDAFSIRDADVNLAVDIANGVAVLTHGIANVVSEIGLKASDDFSSSFERNKGFSNDDFRKVVQRSSQTLDKINSRRIERILVDLCS